MQQTAHATYREVLERRARENQVDFVEGVAIALTPIAFYEVVMAKAFRTLVDDRAKYLNTRQTALFDKGRGLYGIDLARDSISERGRAVLVEGYTDCIAAHQAGFTETVATLGTALTDTQVDLLRRYADELILLFDSDAAGEEAANRAIRVALPRCMSTRLARIPDGKDPSDFLGTAKPEAFSDVLNGASDALEFRWLRTLDRLAGSGSDAGRRDAVLDFLRVVAEALEAGAVDEIQRGLLVNQVAHVLNLDGREVHRLLSRLRPKRSGSPGVESAQRVDSSGSPQGELQCAWVTLLEVVLAEPGALCEVDSVPDPGGVASACDRRLAGVVLALREQLGEFRLADVLARCADAEDVERATELARRGAERGNYADTLRLALLRIHRATAERESDRSRAKLLDAPNSGASDRKTKEGLAAVQDGGVHRRHFLPRHLVGRAIEDPVSIVADNPQDLGSVEHP
ncbi:MAG: toprim domain-containing protein [Planctomycetes bacterium]|nr:toprim domain-containing protein [Planctomycetota bacterium]